MSATLSWVASSNSSVVGYNIYYGAVSQQYTNSVSVGTVTSVMVSGLVENTTYFFAATAHNSVGNESPFSNQTAFEGVKATPDTPLHSTTVPKNYSNDPLLFSLDASAPPGAAINPTNGIVSWTPGRSYASTTNYINVNVTDNNNPAMNISENLVVAVSDYLELRTGKTAVASGGTASLPLTVASSSSVTNVQITLNWPVTQLQNPTLTFFSPIVTGSMVRQGSQLVIELQTAPNQPLPAGTNVVGQLNFQAVSGLPTAILSIPATTASGSAATGAKYANVLMPSGEVVMVGSVPMLRPQVTTRSQRTLSLYALPGTYTLQCTTNLVNWTALTTYAQTNVFQTVALDPAIPHIFYRLHKL